MSELFPPADLLIIDGLNITRRVYEAIPAPDSAEKAEGAVKSTLGSFSRALKEHRPAYVVAPFDYGGNTWRHDIYPEYRKSRKPMAKELKDALPLLFEKLAEMGVTTVSIPGVEADDVIGTLFFKGKERGFERIVPMSTDKDIAQLTAHGAHVRNHFMNEWHDAEWIMQKFGVPPELLGDALAIMGDTSDDIPGIAKVGPKTAAKWLLKYGNLDGVLANAHEISGVVGDNLRKQMHLTPISRQLVSFKTDISLGLTWNKLAYRPGNA